ncbi:DUF2332 family protein [Salinarimonas sp.]|uniref:DUF2332 domain-containing protein n=1 Tax=Salinarimonas sp. TaxID=2766526 RepID=UPI0032D999E4
MTALPEPIHAAFHRQAESCRGLGSPFTAALCALLAARLAPTESAFARRIAGWPTDRAGDDALALRACGALHALARSGDAPGLRAAYPPVEADVETLWAAIEAALADHDARLTDWLSSPPQTNEPKRSGALLGALAILSTETGLPIDLLEIGASAGLNLSLDRFAYALGVAERPGAPDVAVTIRCDWRGAPPDPQTPLVVAHRAGCDRNPLDPGRAEDRARLLAYVWADQQDRLATTAAALEAAAIAPWRVEKADAADWVEAALARRPVAGRVTVLAHTIVWQYLPDATKARIEAALAAAGARATPEVPLARVSMEADDRTGSAALTLTTWPGGGTRALGRADFHGRWVEWG